MSKSLQPTILVKLIISINRREDIRSAAENINLLLKYHKSHPAIVCGVDLSGDPALKTFGDFKHLLAQIKDARIKLALHCGEIENDNEIKEMLDFGFDRLGHGTFVRGENEVRLLQNKNTTIECCLTSNILTQTVPNYAAHHFRKYFDCGHPVVICVRVVERDRTWNGPEIIFLRFQTDDMGVFNTSLSKELSIAARTFGLTLDDIVRLQQTAVSSSFASEHEKQMILVNLSASMK